ncbi:ABC transporter permease [Nocardia gipuzkoensis]|uniref:ABC transporter permease n=1 Tax=Nocardia gipuzkoensis TaxID=2749991 RepID=UPI003EE2D597
MNAVVTPGVGLVALCTVMIVGAAVVYGIAGLGPVSVAPRAAARGAAQLAAVALILAAALAQLWSSLLVLAVMFAAAAATSARRAEAGSSALWLTTALGAGLGVVLPILLLSGVVPLTGVALVPIGGIILGGTMTATSLAARRALDALDDRWGEVEAALALGFSDRAARLEIIRRTATDALLPGIDQTRTVGLVTLPGAFVGVLLATGSAAQAAAVQIMVLTGLLLAQSCAVAVTIELVARGSVHRAGYPPRAPRGPALRSGSPTTSGDQGISRMSIGCRRTG